MSPKGFGGATISLFNRINGGVGMSVPAGWYDDGSGRQRWWDGSAWGVYAQDVSSVQVEARAADCGQVAVSVGRPVKSSGMFNALG